MQCSFLRIMWYWATSTVLPRWFSPAQIYGKRPCKKMFASDPKYPEGSPGVPTGEESGLGPDFRISVLVTFTMHCSLVRSPYTSMKQAMIDTFYLPIKMTNSNKMLFTHSRRTYFCFIKYLKASFYLGSTVNSLPPQMPKQHSGRLFEAWKFYSILTYFSLLPVQFAKVYNHIPPCKAAPLL